MKTKNVLRFALCALTLVFAVSYTRPAHALPDSEIADYYFSGCGSNQSIVGLEIWGCDGSHSTWGTLNGDWMTEVIRACDDSSSDATNWENCGGTWVYRSTDACQCSH
jgi:hypothetical protein